MRKLRQILRIYPHFWIAIIILLLLIFTSLIAPYLPFDPTKTDVTKMNQPPSIAHFFGTDEVGRDYFIRVLYGGRVSLIVAFLAMLTSATIGTAVGLISGYFGGWIDSLLMRIVDILSSIPWIVLVIVLSVFLKPGLETIILVIGGFSWMTIARLIRAETLSLKEREYVVYAQFIKQNPWVIIMKHIFPAVIPTLLVAATGSIAGAIMTESTLSFLGLGIQPPYASWGSLLQTAQNSMQRAPHMAIIPGLFIMSTVFAFNMLGNLLNRMFSEVI